MKMNLRTLALAVAAALWSVPALAADAPEVNTGNTAWILVSSALVMLMTPGLAFFYAGMVSRKNVVSTLLQNFAALGVVGVLWVAVGYSLAFSEGNAFIGGTDWAFLKGLGTELYSADTGIPHYAFIAFQMMFAIITPALITGAIAERVHFKAWLFFMTLWSLCIYVPIAHWVWAPDGWLYKMGGLDFAGGLVVHTSSGVSALVAAMMFGKRISKGESSPPNDVPMILMGAALLWFGWFGFNAGSALTSGFLASHAFVTTFVGAAAAMVAWLAVDWQFHKPSAVGCAIGLVVGLVVITPAAGFVTVTAAVVICALSSIICNFIARWFKGATHLDDALDVFACHGVGGMLGAVATGLFATSAVNPAVTKQGLLISGESALFQANLIGVLAVAVYASFGTFILIKIVNVLTPVRVSEDAEAAGLDASLHGEAARHHDRRHHERRSAT